MDTVKVRRAGGQEPRLPAAVTIPQTFTACGWIGS